jgi:hypothetical protein
MADLPVNTAANLVREHFPYGDPPELHRIVRLVEHALRVGRGSMNAAPRRQVTRQPETASEALEAGYGFEPSTR